MGKLPVLVRSIAKAAWLSLVSLAPLLCAAEHPAVQTAGVWGWELPQQLSDTNTTVTFEVDSTWHLIKGVTSQIDGRVWLADSKDPLSIRAQVRFPVVDFATGNDSRDERMREVMDSERAPYVTLDLDSFQPTCAPEVYAAQTPCSVRLDARLSIRGHQKPLALTATLTQASGKSSLVGDTRLSWADFGVEDPSILIARLDPEVAISFSVRLPTKTQKGG